MIHPVVRSLVGVFAGVVVCGVLIGLTEYGASVIHPPPTGFDMNDRELVRAHAEKAPPSAMLLVLAGYAVGTFVGAWLAARVAGWAPLVHAGVVAGLFFVGSVMNLRSVPGHPVWFAVVNLAMFVPIAWLAAWLARPRGQQAGPPVVASK